MLEPLAAIVDHLARASIPFMLTGSFASGVHGEPRATQDIDMVIDPGADALDRFLAGLDRHRYYVSDDGARRALDQRDMFKVIDLVRDWKIELMLRKDRPYSRIEFERREVVEVQGVRLALTTAEDTILSKLERSKVSGSERQARDIAGILRISSNLDWTYLPHWAEVLGVAEDLRRAEMDAAT